MDSSWTPVGLELDSSWTPKKALGFSHRPFKLKNRSPWIPSFTTTVFLGDLAQQIKKEAGFILLFEKEISTHSRRSYTGSANGVKRYIVDFCIIVWYVMG